MKIVRSARARADRSERDEMPKYAVNQKVYRTAGDVLDTETITRVTTDRRGQHWYCTVTESGERRTFALPEREIRPVD